MLEILAYMVARHYFDDYFRIISLFLFIFCLSSFSTYSYANDSIEAVIHPSVELKNYSRNSLRAVFGMRLKTWPNGLPVRVFVLPDDAALHNIFTKEKLNIFPYQLRAGWDKLIFSGTGQAPFLVKTEEEMRERIASTPGAIGYLKRVNIDDSIHVLNIE